TESKFNTVFRTAAARVNEFGREWANTAGLTQNEFRELASNVGAVVDGFRFGAEAGADFSVEILKLAGDLQSFHNVPIEETFNALRSGLTGETEPLKRFGIILRDTEVKERALAVARRE